MKEYIIDRYEVAPERALKELREMETMLRKETEKGNYFSNYCFHMGPVAIADDGFQNAYECLREQAVVAHKVARSYESELFKRCELSGDNAFDEMNKDSGRKILRDSQLKVLGQQISLLEKVLE